MSFLITLLLISIPVRGDNLFQAPSNLAGSPQAEKSFPVINIRFSYPPTLTDPVRTLALGHRQAGLVTATSRAAATIEDDMAVLVKHLLLQQRIINHLNNIPTDLMTPMQKRYVKKLADSIPLSSFGQGFMGTRVQGVVKNPQINVVVEDNRAAFAVPSEMTPIEGTKFVMALSRSWMANRRLIIELLKVNFQRITLLYNFFSGRMRETADMVDMLKKEQPKSSFLESENDLQDTAMIDIGEDFDYTVKPVHKITKFVDTHESTAFLDPEAMASVEFPIIMALRSRVLEGGRGAAKALSTLINLWNQQKGTRKSIKNSMVMVDCNALLMQSNTPDYLRNLAGSLMALISGLPAWSSITDQKSGSNAHVNIIVPRPSRVYRADKEIALGTGGD